MNNRAAIGSSFWAMLVLLLCIMVQPANAETGAPTMTAARAHWLSHELIAWDVPASAQLAILTATGENAPGYEPPTEHRLIPAGVVDGSLAAANPHLRGIPLWRIADADRDAVRTWLKGAVQVIARGANGLMLHRSGLQIGAVLDDLYANDAQLGARFDGGALSIKLWAPTAREVRLHLFSDARDEAHTVFAMTEDAATGVWELAGQAGWNRKYYLYEIRVFIPEIGQIMTNFVTDPYALNLSADSKRTQIVNLDDADLKPVGWNRLERSLPTAPEDRVFYELHVRDFSITDSSVPQKDRGRFTAFAVPGSNGMKHLRGLAQAGLSDVHLLPTYDCATIPELPVSVLSPPDLTAFSPDGETQQAAIKAIRDRDGFNWCYDPLHYMAAEGSYSSNAEGTARILEFRQMILGLGKIGLGAVLDVVFNHTMASGQQPTAVLDRIVPGYYHRLDDAGAVATSTCCANTATERRMMEKLMLDSLRIWARDYKVSGFRFDLMGHHSRASIMKARDHLRQLSLGSDGVDGPNIYIYGEGWNFGEVGNDARFVQATQLHMGRGTGIGTFNDRIRDAIRGGSVGDKGIDLVRNQGFASGLFTAPNAENAANDASRNAALAASDHIRAALAGSIAQYPLIAADGKTRTTAQLSYGGSPVGYASDPAEVINYAEAHDNQTLFDSNAYKLPRDTSRADRVRWQNIATSIVILAQGVPFLHAGQELLRSKSLDHNSFNSGDWFNRLDFGKRQNGWGRGLPQQDGNQQDWPIARILLADPNIAVGSAEIRRAETHLRDMLAIRKSSPLLRLQSGQEVIDNVHFGNSGPDQIPGLIVMHLGQAGQPVLVVVVNATRQTQSFSMPAGQSFRLHPVLQGSADRTVRRARFRKGQLITPALTTAVFIARPQDLQPDSKISTPAPR